jgi:hypothetical protein
VQFHSKQTVDLELEPQANYLRLVAVKKSSRVCYNIATSQIIITTYKMKVTESSFPPADVNSGTWTDSKLFVSYFIKFEIQVGQIVYVNTTDMQTADSTPGPQLIPRTVQSIH